MSETLKEELETLLKLPGWLRVREYARQEWVVGLPTRMMQAAEEPQADAAIKRVKYAADQINIVLSWPQDVVKHLEQQTVTANQGHPVGRRGTL